MKNRYYDPTMGRVVSQDPIGFSGGLNLFAYANNNPVSFVDPNGLCAQASAWEHMKTVAGYVWGDVKSAINYTVGGQYELDLSPEWQNRLMNLEKNESFNKAGYFVSGYGDVMSIGITKALREEVGQVSMGLKYENYYNAGQVTGEVLSTTTGIAAGVKLAGKKMVGKEFSHWIPKRAGGPVSILNGNYVSTMKHALSDPYRYRFMSKAFKEANPMPILISQQWNRLPYVYNGGILGLGYGLSGAEMSSD